MRHQPLGGDRRVASNSSDSETFAGVSKKNGSAKQYSSYDLFNLWRPACQLLPNRNLVSASGKLTDHCDICATAFAKNPRQRINCVTCLDPTAIQILCTSSKLRGSINGQSSSHVGARPSVVRCEHGPRSCDSHAGSERFKACWTGSAKPNVGDDLRKDQQLTSARRVFDLMHHCCQLSE